MLDQYTIKHAKRTRNVSVRRALDGKPGPSLIPLQPRRTHRATCLKSHEPSSGRRPANGDDRRGPFGRAASSWVVEDSANTGRSRRIADGSQERAEESKGHRQIHPSRRGAWITRRMRRTKTTGQSWWQGQVNNATAEATTWTIRSTRTTSTTT